MPPLNKACRKLEYSWAVRTSSSYSVRDIVTDGAIITAKAAVVKIFVDQV